MTFNYHRVPEQIDPSAWIAPGADVMGDVLIGARSSVWFASVIRGDCERIEIGEDSNIQDGSILHADPGRVCRVGNRVTVGHGAIVHGATVEDDSMIGIRATVLNGAVIGRGSLVAAGALVPEGCVIPPKSLVMGIPAKVVREITETDRARMTHAWTHYVQAAIEARRVIES